MLARDLGTRGHRLVNPNGEVDGLLLEDGTQVAFAPHLSSGLVAAVKAKDAVEITGRRRENAKVVRASMIKNTATGRRSAASRLTGARRVNRVRRRSRARCCTPVVTPCSSCSNPTAAPAPRRMRG